MRLTLLLDKKLLPGDGEYLFVPAGAEASVDDWQPCCSIDEFWNSIAPDIDSLNKACDACLGIGDDEFIDWTRCNALSEWVEGRLSSDCPALLVPFYSVMDEFAQRAVKLKTGVDVEL